MGSSGLKTGTLNSPGRIIQFVYTDRTSLTAPEDQGDGLFQIYGAREIPSPMLDLRAVYDLQFDGTVLQGCKTLSYDIHNDTFWSVKGMFKALGKSSGKKKKGKGSEKEKE